MEHRIPLDKKLELAQYIREENMGNRMKIRQREKILYGVDTQPPLYDKNALPTQAMQQRYAPDGFEGEKIPQGFLGTFKYRMIIAVFLFAGFLVCDTNGGTIGSYTMNDLHDMIVADSFHLYEGDGIKPMEGFAALLDFGE